MQPLEENDPMISSSSPIKIIQITVTLLIVTWMWKNGKFVVLHVLSKTNIPQSLIVLLHVPLKLWKIYTKTGKFH